MNNSIEKLFQKYLDGTCTKEEGRKVLKWLQTSEGRAKLSEQLDADLEALEELELQDEQQIAPRKKQGLEAEKKYTEQVTPISQAYSVGNFGKIAAAISLLLLSAYVLYFFWQETFQPETNTEHVATVEWVERGVAKGKKMTLVLPDRTVVKLNAGSSIRFCKNFQPDKRDVFLEGEAYFEVVPDPKRPFTVHAGNLGVTALGTTFNVKSYPEDEQIKVALAEGKVKVENKVLNEANNKHPFLELLPGEGVKYKKSGHEWVKGKYGKGELLWKEGVIAFQDASFEEVVADLERWYGVEIVCVESKKRHWKYSGEFDNQSLKNILTVMGHARKFSFDINGKKIKIY